jgi:hypothetical protein
VKAPLTQNLTRGRTGILKMKLQGSGLFHPKTLQSKNCQPAENRLSLNGLEFVHGQLFGRFWEKSGKTMTHEPGNNWTLMPMNYARSLPSVSVVMPS